MSKSSAPLLVQLPIPQYNASVCTGTGRARLRLRLNFRIDILMQNAQPAGILPCLVSRIILLMLWLILTSSRDDGICSDVGLYFYVDIVLENDNHGTTHSRSTYTILIPIISRSIHPPSRSIPSFPSCLPRSLSSPIPLPLEFLLDPSTSTPPPRAHYPSPITHTTCF
ncbi:hypothetical protein BDV98DRAFT_372984 [Pterulicium gracile]|uniref:Uncharacterized protein n=1 Tax=Pterulicium gracile TaxID=1884261 RepID=A0A5C3Q107_9AGAR|nr:hypothetical protein BDV98DRAFT_372984 [Pterula gracilis]